MVTFVHKHEKFSDALKALVELDYDAVEAYQTAIEKLENTDYKNLLKKFQADHERHIEEVSAILKKHHKSFHKGPDTKRFLTKGKVFLGSLIGDKAILSAMASNEEDTNKAYEGMSYHKDKWPEADEIINRGLEDERRHLAAIQELLEKIEKNDKNA